MATLKFGNFAATKAQIQYIEQLSIDLLFSIHQRDTHIESIVNRKSKPDGLTKPEASQVIEKFKEWKEAKS